MNGAASYSPPAPSASAAAGGLQRSRPGEKKMKRGMERAERAVGGSVGILFFCGMVEDDLTDVQTVLGMGSYTPG
jgi:hypothetical protein